MLLRACLAAFLGTAALSASAADPTADAGRAEMEKGVISLTPRPSTDTTPVEFSVGGIHYRVPRNYLVTMDHWEGGPQVLVTLRVNLPDLKPLTEETRQCFSVAPLYRPLGCEPFKFWIEGKPLVSADEAFANARKLFRDGSPMPGPDGFEKYEMGPETARSEYYKKAVNGKTLLYTCLISDNRGKRAGICHPISDQTPAGAGINFLFDLDHVSDVETIDTRARDLVESFTDQ
jgi:hypothetical protein